MRGVLVTARDLGARDLIVIRAVCARVCVRACLHARIHARPCPRARAAGGVAPPAGLRRGPGRPAGGGGVDGGAGPRDARRRRAARSLRPLPAAPDGPPLTPAAHRRGVGHRPGPSGRPGRGRPAGHDSSGFWKNPSRRSNLPQAMGQGQRLRKWRGGGGRTGCRGVRGCLLGRRAGGMLAGRRPSRCRPAAGLPSGRPLN
jgi:hypothetical protein